MRFGLSVLLLIISPSLAIAADRDVALFGITLGRPLTLQDCPHKPNGSYDHLFAKWTGLCVDLQDPIDHAWGTRRFHVYFPSDSAPRWVRSEALWVQTLKGKVASIEISTCGVSCQGAALDALREKFGPPTAQSDRKLANRLGAKFTSHDAAWVIHGQSVVLQGIADDVDWGAVTATTPEYDAAEKAYQGKKSSLAPKL